MLYIYKQYAIEAGKRFIGLKKEKKHLFIYWKTVIQFAISILTAALTAMSTTSCMGYGLWASKE